jgi:hypothetical protein
LKTNALLQDLRISYTSAAAGLQDHGPWIEMLESYNYTLSFLHEDPGTTGGPLHDDERIAACLRRNASIRGGLRRLQKTIACFLSPSCLGRCTRCGPSHPPLQVRADRQRRRAGRSPRFAAAEEKQPRRRCFSHQRQEELSHFAPSPIHPHFEASQSVAPRVGT